MKVTLWGTRGSLPTPGPETVRYGGNTPCVEVRRDNGALLVLDAGTGIRRLGMTLGPETGRVDILLTHLHMDHIQGLGFFDPLFEPDVEVHIWGPSSPTLDLRSRLLRYLSPPLFPVRLRDLPCRLKLHDVVPVGEFGIDGFEVRSALICHPGATVGYRIHGDGASLAYLPDHEPALGVRNFPGEPEWTSGFDLVQGVDLLIHDAQYSAEEYLEHVGWGHSALPDTLKLAAAAGVRRLIPFHHDPAHTDEDLDRLFAESQGAPPLPFEVVLAIEGARVDLPAAISRSRK